MRRTFLGRCAQFSLLTLAGAVQARASTQPAKHKATDVKVRIEELLSAYAANQPDHILALLDPKGWIVFGSDVAEMVSSEPGLRDMMRSDFALWQTAAFGAIRDLNIQTDGELASAMFHVDFSAGGRASVPVRFCTTWRRTQAGWVLGQCANTVPTVHSSAAELLKR